MVYYNKDDITEFSKDLKLNRIKVKDLPKGKYLSEDDVPEEYDEGSEGGRSRFGRGNKARSMESMEGSPHDRQPWDRG